MWGNIHSNLETIPHLWDKQKDSMRYDIYLYIIAFFFIKGGEKLKLFMYMIFVRLSLRLLLFFWQLNCQNIISDFYKGFWVLEFF